MLCIKIKKAGEIKLLILISKKLGWHFFKFPGGIKDE
jgi:hypothetical protein